MSGSSTTLPATPPTARPDPDGAGPVGWERVPPAGRPGRHQTRAGQVVTAIVLGAVAVAGWPLKLALAAPQPLQFAVVVAHVAGMLAGYGVLVMIALMSRAPALERGIGADTLARWHARGGRAVIGLILAHAGAAVLAWAQSRQESVPLALWHVLQLPGLTAATLGTLILGAVGAASARAARKRLSHETWHTLHLLTYVGVALSFVHQLAGPDLTGHRLLQLGWALLYCHVFALVLRHRVLTPLRQAARHRLRVTALIPEGPGVVSIEVSGEHLAELAAEPGQFFRWRFLTPDTWRTAHPFSLSAAPAGDRLRLTVKALGDGSRLLQDIAVGTWVVAEGPYGAMTAARRTRRDVLLVAGGVGITPMRALFESMPIEPGQDLTLLYRARGFENVLFRDELDRIAVRRGARVRYLVEPDDDGLSPAGLLRHVPDVADRDVYLCGSPGMAASVRESLLQAGLPEEHLHEERFDL